MRPWRDGTHAEDGAVTDSKTAEQWLDLRFQPVSEAKTFEIIRAIQAETKPLWRTTPKPNDGQLCFVVINGKPLPDVLVFRSKIEQLFRQWWRIKFDEVEAWGSFGDIPAYSASNIKESGRDQKAKTQRAAPLERSEVR
jgi:hypothetical protein